MTNRLDSLLPDAGRNFAARLAAARRETDRLFDLLRPGAVAERPIPHRHRLIFYLGHLDAFDWNLVAPAGFASPPFREAFDRLFSFGIDPGEAGLPAEPASAWPAESAVRDYKAGVRETVDRCLEAADFGDPRR